MSAKTEAVKNGSAVKPRKLYAVKNGVAVKPRKLYGVRNGLTVALSGGEFEYSFTGRSQLVGDVLCLLSSGDLTIRSLGKFEGGAQIFLVNNGTDGGRAQTSSYNDPGADGGQGRITYYHNGGSGGKAGRRKTQSVTLTETSYHVTIGSTTSFGSLASTSGEGSSGGPAFEDASAVTIYPAGTAFGVPGGNGYSYTEAFSGAGTPVGGSTTAATGNGGAGQNAAGKDAAANTGSGGGGAGATTANSGTGSAAAGKGASGIVCIRPINRG